MKLLLLFLALLGGFLFLDLSAWLLGIQTMSQWVIATADADPVMAFYFLCILSISQTFFAFHFELI